MRGPREYLIREVVRTWGEFKAVSIDASDQSLTRLDRAWAECEAALDRFAAAYGDGKPPRSG